MSINQFTYLPMYQLIYLLAGYRLANSYLVSSESYLVCISWPVTWFASLPVIRYKI